MNVHRLDGEWTAVQRDDVPEVGRLGAEAGGGLPHEVVLVPHLEERLAGALVPDRRRHLQVHAGPAAHRAAQVSRPDLGRVGQQEQLVVQRVEDPACPLRPVDREVGTGDVAHEQAVATQHGPRMLAPLGGDQGERGVLGPVARCVKRAHRDAAELELPPVVERLVVVVGRRLAVHMDRGARGRGEPTVPGDMVGVVVRLEDVLDAHSEKAGEP
jgi:hypothetical protein